MFTLFLIAILFVLVAVGLFYGLKKNKTVLRTIAPLAACLVAAILAAASCVRTVPTGHTGIVTVFGKVKDQTYEAGVHFCAPWEEVVNMDNRNQKASVDLLCFSSDIQEVSVTYTVNYQISKQNAQMIYKEIGVSYYETVITPSIQEAVKSEFAKYTAEELLNNRSKLSTDIRNTLTAELSAYNIVMIDSSIENLDFSDVFTDAVEAKQVAEQKSKQAKIEQEQKNMEAEAAAKRAEIDAQAAAAVAEIEAKAAAAVQSSSRIQHSQERSKPMPPNMQDKRILPWSVSSATPWQRIPTISPTRIWSIFSSTTTSSSGTERSPKPISVQTNSTASSLPLPKIKLHPPLQTNKEGAASF